MSKEDITKKLRNKKYRNISIGVIVCLFIVSMIVVGASTKSPVEPPDTHLQAQEEGQSEAGETPHLSESQRAEKDSEKKDNPSQTDEEKPSDKADSEEQEPQGTISDSDKETPKDGATSGSQSGASQSGGGSQSGGSQSGGTEGEDKEKPSSGSQEPQKPEPAPPQETAPPQEPAPKPKDTINVSIEIECKSISENTSLVTDKSILDYIPKDGYILHKKTVEVKADTNAFELTEHACNANGIALDFSYAPAFGTNYIKGIGYIYEKMAGSQSGWMFMVNGTFPNRGSDSYVLKDGDHVRWTYVTGL